MDQSLIYYRDSTRNLMTGLLQLHPRSLIGGIVSLVPSVFVLLRRCGGGSSQDPVYCYDVWARHWAALRQCGMARLPDTMVEIGPGSSLGVGLAALLSGVNRAWALDVETYADVEGNLAVLEALTRIARDRRGAPSEGGETPLSPAEVERLTEASRSELISRAIRDLPIATDSAVLRYVAPWSDPGVLAPQSVDLIISQAVLEHVTDPAMLYRACANWLRPGGWMRHVIDLRSHGVTRAWNGHYAIGDGVWRITMGRRNYLINRVPASEHIRLMRDAGFEILSVNRREERGGITRAELAPRFRDLDDADLRCKGLQVVARKPPETSI